jgi:hypothetical protein
MDAREEALVKSFVLSSKRDRYLNLLATARGRNRVRSYLDHFDDLDRRVCKLVAAPDQNPIALLKILRDLGAPSRCYVMSSGELDGHEMELSDALAGVVGYGFGTFISCVTGRLAYFESETAKRRYICHSVRDH